MENNNNNNNTNINVSSSDRSAKFSSGMTAHTIASATNMSTGLDTGPLEPGGTMSTGMTHVTTLSSQSERTNSIIRDNEEVYKPPAHLFDRLSLIEKGSINPGKYGYLAIKVYSEDTFFRPEALRNATGYTGFRATMVFTVVVAAPPQASGILKLAWWPCNTRDGDNGYDKSTLMPMYSQVQNVELNLAEGSTAVLKVPYTFYNNYLRLNASTALTYGYLGLGTYTPIGGAYAATSIVSYSMYLSYEDVELINPGSTLIAQSGLESKAVGPITQIMNGVTRLAKASIGAPIIGAYASTLAWVSGGIGAVAAHYGWSKPNDAGGTMMQPTTGRNHNNVLGISNAADFGMFGNNCVKPITDITTTGVDEMAICHLTCIPSPIFRGKLTTANLADTIVYSCQVNPCMFYYQTSDTAYTQISYPPSTTRAGVIPTPMSYFGEIFNYWRGDLTFRVKFARSKFSAGRVMVGFNPKPDSLAGNVYSGSRINYSSVIADFRSDSVVDLDVPYSYPLGMCSTYKIAGQNIGVFFIRVLDPIIVPTGVSPDLPFVVEVFSKCGMAFGGVSPSYQTSCIYSETLYAQSGFEIFTETIGEAILSVKQLMMRPTFQHEFTTTTIKVDDALVPRWALWNATANGYATDDKSTFMNLISPAFRFFRGGMVAHAISKTHTSIHMYPVTDVTGVSNVGLPVLVEHGHNAAVKIPYWSPHKMLPVSLQISAPKNAFRNYQLTCFTLPSEPGHLTALVAGDDFQLGGFTGFPPVVACGGRVYAT